MTSFCSRLTATAVALAISLAGAALAGDAGHGPYVVRGNTHMIVGVTLDEAAVRAALPEGLEPTEGITGGYNIYTSGGGHDHPAYTRAYVWADLAGYDSVSGPARYVLWGVTGPGSDVAQAEGINLFDGASEITETGATVVGVGLEGEAEIIRAEITLNDEPCGEASGILNYPVVLPDGGGNASISFRGRHLRRSAGIARGIGRRLPCAQRLQADASAVGGPGTQLELRGNDGRARLGLDRESPGHRRQRLSRPRRRSLARRARARRAGARPYASGRR